MDEAPQFAELFELLMFVGLLVVVLGAAGAGLFVWRNAARRPKRRNRR